MTPEELATLREGWVTYASTPVLKWDDAKMAADLEALAVRVRAEALDEVRRLFIRMADEADADTRGVDSAIPGLQCAATEITLRFRKLADGGGS